MNKLKNEIIDAIDGLCPDKSAQGSKDYIEFLIDQYTAKKELEARLDELQTQFYWISQFNQDVAYNLEKRITQLQSQLTNNKEGIEK